MSENIYEPVFELTRGKTVESVHWGAVAVVDVHGNLIAWYGDPEAVTFLRSTAKPFQALPFIEHHGPEFFGLTQKEVALLCASHNGSDDHAATAASIQAKAGVLESELMCGVHEPLDPVVAQTLRERKEVPTPNRHNCSGKHSGMLAYVKMKQRQGESIPVDLPYIDFSHPVQKEILQTFAEMTGLPVEDVALGVDGCSAPNFAAPLRNAALGFARLCDPETGQVLPPERARACHVITAAMRAYPEMVGGNGRFDTLLMRTAGGKLVCKGGAEAFTGIGLMPGSLGPGSPAAGIAMKIADGDARGLALHGVALEVLRQLGVLSAAELEALDVFGPCLPRYNWRKVTVGQSYPKFQLHFAGNGRK